MGRRKSAGHKIKEIEPDSIAEELELESGDVLMSVNGEEVQDVFDYQFLIQEEYLEILIQKANGEEWELEIEKEPEEDLGIVFENGLMDEYRSCHNKCIFCFIDQMPPDMRETLYFKDDDSRLSFLQGNYVTLTNMNEKDIERIIKYHLAPINISFQTTNPELRCRMLNNRFAGEALKKAERLFEAGIEMNGQIVLCKNVNDGAELERSISDLGRYIPYLKSVSVVPVGLTKFRDGLYPLEAFTKEDARSVLDMIHKWQDYYWKQSGTHFIHASDEWYLLAEYELPQEENYDGYLQLENGVGMLRLLKNEVKAVLEKMQGDTLKRDISIATGELAAPVLEELVNRICEKFPECHCNIYAIRNDFFGSSITVSGLLTGQDILAQLSGRNLGEALLLPSNVLRSGEEVFLDDMLLSELEEKLNVPIRIVGSQGRDLVDNILKKTID